MIWVVSVRVGVECDSDCDLDCAFDCWFGWLSVIFEWDGGL